MSQRVADMFWPGESPLGRTLILWRGQNNTPGEVIGVVGNMREQSLEDEPTLAVYFPAGSRGTSALQLVLHTRGDPKAIAPAVHALVRSIDPALPVHNVRTLEEIVTGSVATRRFTVVLLAAFAGLALVLALVGVYGVLAYAVARRTSEIGVRVALGARHERVLRLVLAQGLKPVMLGMAAGLVATYWLSQLMTSLLFGITPRDPLTYAGVGAALALVAVLACYLPARNVLRVDPVVALRTE